MPNKEISKAYVQNLCGGSSCFLLEEYESWPQFLTLEENDALSTKAFKKCWLIHRILPSFPPPPPPTYQNSFDFKALWINSVECAVGWAT